MNNISENFNFHKNNPSDINEHLETLLKYSKECDSIIEMGVRHVVSTWAFLQANPKKLISYDISYHSIDKIKEVEDIAKKESINFKFILADVLKIEIEQVDLLFIDTLHTYSQLIQELKRHSSKVNKYIILHDTTTFGFNDEDIYSHASDTASKEATKNGLQNAINDFLEDNKDGKNWLVHEVYTNNNGLTILKRK